MITNVMPFEAVEARSLLWKRLPALYILVALLVSTALCVLTPPFFTPDESNHARREITIGGGEILVPVNPQGVGGWLDGNAVELMRRSDGMESRMEARFSNTHERPNGRVDAAEVKNLQEIRWGGPAVFSVFWNTAVYPPILYLPQALMWRLGQVLGWTILHTLFAVRLTAAWCGIAFGFLALRISGALRWPLFAYFLLPTLLSLQASCSQDALLLGVSGLVAALVVRAIAAERLLGVGELAMTSVLLAVMVGARPPYLPLALILLLPALDLEGWEARRFALPAAGGLFVASCLAMWELLVRPLGNVTGLGAEPGAQVQFLLRHPAAGLLHLSVATFGPLPKLMLKGVALLGVNDVYFPSELFGLMLLGIGGIALAAPWDGLRRSRATLVLILAVAATVLGVSLADYIVWTPVGARAVSGIQSRYFVPLYPLVWLALRGWIVMLRPASFRGWGRKVLPIATGLLVVAVLATPWVAARRFYDSDLVAALRATLR